MTAAARKPVERPALRIVDPSAPSLGLILSELWDPELERNALGAAMLGEPMPTWLTPSLFFPSQHRAIYEAAQTVGGNVAHVNVWLRESAPKYGPIIAGPVELAAMCSEFLLARSMGWAFDWAEIRDLAEKRALVEMMFRATIELRHGRAVAGVKAKLCEFFETKKEQGK